MKGGKALGSGSGSGGAAIACDCCQGGEVIPDSNR